MSNILEYTCTERGEFGEGEETILVAGVASREAQDFAGAPSREARDFAKPQRETGHNRSLRRIGDRPQRHVWDRWHGELVKTSIGRLECGSLSGCRVMVWHKV